MPEEQKFASKHLRIQGLKPSDYYLYKTERDHFGYTARQLLVLGLRLIYGCAGGGVTRDQLLHMAAEIYAENLDIEDKEMRPVYKTLAQQLRM